MRLIDNSEMRLLGIAQLGLSNAATVEAMLWDELDLNDPEDRRFGDFELLERIGHGGMGVVFRAMQVSLDREVAIKFIVGGLADNPRAISTFFAEARAAARLHHPHIVPVFETGKVDGMHFFSMPLLKGHTLAQRMSAGRTRVLEVVELMLKLCAAVEYAHGFGLLHLDLKPANVLFDEHGQPLVGDFGLARHMDADGGVDALEMSGTVAYMAPEQLGSGTRRLSRATDIYALGAILYELLVGNPPCFGVEDGNRLLAGKERMIVSPRSIDGTLERDVDAICMKCLHADPSRRYPDVSSLSADIARFRDGNSVSVREPTWRERLVRSARLRPGVALAVAVALSTLVLGLLSTSWQWRRAELARNEAYHQQELATLEATRNQKLSGFMAAAFPAGNAIRDDRSISVRDAVSWLKQNAADDPSTQRAVLASFRQALGEANKGDVVAAFTAEILDQLGEGYRQEQVERLVQKADRDSLISAALIGIPRGAETSSAAHELVLGRLFNEHQDDALALYVAALACHVQPYPCTHHEYFETLIAKFPDNAVNWVLAPAGARSSKTDLAVQVRRAAVATEFNDRLPELSLLIRNALRDQPAPSSILEPMQGFLSEPEVAPSLQRNAIDSVALPRYLAFVQICKPDSSAIHEVVGLKDACGAFASHGMHSPEATVLAKMIGSAILRRLYKGTRLEQEAIEYRRRYVWLSEHAGSEPGGDDVFRHDLIKFGEWEALQRQAERLGFQRTPPPSWIPENPGSLLLSEERKSAPPK
jgi:serine/threonine protein kinase